MPRELRSLSHADRLDALCELPNSFHELCHHDRIVYEARSRFLLGQIENLQDMFIYIILCKNTRIDNLENYILHGQ